jgi:transposase
VDSSGLLDVRGLMRARLAIRSYQTCLKSRILAAINRYGLRGGDGSSKDWFSGAGRVQLNTWLMGLPEYTRFSTIEEWRLVDEMETAIEKMEKQIAAKIGKIGYVRLLDTLPGVGKILAPTLYLEIGNVNRFPTAEHLASYAGLVPKVISSGGKTFHGRVSKESNHYLKWAFVEAANCIVMHTWKYEQSHVGKLYARLKAAKGHGKAAVAVGRHLAEASWWILRKAQAYREPAPATTSSSKNG